MLPPCSLTEYGEPRIPELSRVNSFQLRVIRRSMLVTLSKLYFTLGLKIKWYP